MSVRLVASPLAAPRHDHWAAIGGCDNGLDPARQMPDLGRLLEEAFDASAAEWWELGRVLGAEPSATLAHAPACAANASDLGQMLAWTRLVANWAKESLVVLVVCDDPWLFRHFAALPGVVTRGRPLLWPRSLRLTLRGYAARAAVALRMAKAAWTLRHQRKTPQGGSHLLVYGHPASTPDGLDAYFGPLMRQLPRLGRLLHVDCGVERTRALAADGRSRSLHAWGSPLFALTGLIFARWRPRTGSWLVRRAAALEGGTGQAAAIRWQIHCQSRWLKAVRPQVVAWPWENHSWERALVRSAKGVRTLGYQHSVIGGQMLNYGMGSNPDGAASIPDHILCSGAATMRRLAAWGLPLDRLGVGGALRFAQPLTVTCDPARPVFLALPFDQQVAAEMVEAARAAAKQGWRFLVRDHPMTPFAFEDSDAVRRAPGPLNDQISVSAVVYAATTVGLEALLAGLPTLRFRPSARISIDILPDGVTVPVSDAQHLAQALAQLSRPVAPDRSDIFAAADPQVWQSILEESSP
jgi:hypothetical protein